MTPRVFTLFLLFICSLQFLALPARGIALNDNLNEVNYSVEESGECESVEELCNWVGHLPSLDCQHEETVGELHLHFQLPRSSDLVFGQFSRGPPA